MLFFVYRKEDDTVSGIWVVQFRKFVAHYYWAFIEILPRSLHFDNFQQKCGQWVLGIKTVHFTKFTGLDSLDVFYETVCMVNFDTKKELFYLVLIHFLLFFFFVFIGVTYFYWCLTGHVFCLAKAKRRDFCSYSDQSKMLQQKYGILFLSWQRLH